MCVHTVYTHTITDRHHVIISSFIKGLLLKAAEMKEDTGILLHIDKDCVAMEVVLLPSVHQVLDQVHCNTYWDHRRRNVRYYYVINAVV